MFFGLGRFPVGQSLAHVCAETFGGPAAITLGGIGQVVLKIGLPQALTGPVGQSRHAVGAHVEKRRNFCRFLSFDIQMPQHHLPPFGQRCERVGRGSPFKACTGRIEERHVSIEFEVVAGDPYSLVGADSIDVKTADCGQQIGTERQVGPTPILQLDEDLRERFGHQVVGIGSGKQLVGQANGCMAVPLEQNAEGCVFSGADCSNQLRVAQLRVVCNDVHHWVNLPSCPS